MGWVQKWGPYDEALSPSSQKMAAGRGWARVAAVGRGVHLWSGKRDTMGPLGQLWRRMAPGLCNQLADRECQPEAAGSQSLLSAGGPGPAVTVCSLQPPSQLGLPSTCHASPGSLLATAKELEARF